MEIFEGFLYDLPDVGQKAYSPATDAVHRFEDSRLDHVSYWDEERRQMTLQWVSHLILDELVEMGLPETHRETVTSLEFSAWQEWQREQQENIIDSLVMAETAHLDEELDHLFD